MKSTGIVRRIDDLGRVVIPKEIRKTFRIRVGSPLEIFMGREKEIVFRKYNPIVDLTEYSEEYAEALQETLGHQVFICDDQRVLSVAGISKKKINEDVGSEVLKSLRGNKSILQTESGEYELFENSEDYQGFIIEPITLDNKAIGGIVVIQNPKAKQKELSEVEQQSVKIAAYFLGKKYAMRVEKEQGATH